MNWGHFKRVEFACNCGCDFDTVDAQLLWVLNAIRDTFSRPVIVHSGARCRKHNIEVGGVSHSQHLCGKAADISVEGVEAQSLATQMEAMFPTYYGIGKYSEWVHIDVRPWMSRWSRL